MSDFASVLRRFVAAFGGVLLTAGATAAVAQASYGEIGHFGGVRGTGAGQFEASEEANVIGVDPSEGNSVFVGDLPDEKNEFRIQKFVNSGGGYKVTTSVKFKPKDDEAKNEEPDVIEGIAVDPELKRIYVLASELRPSTLKLDTEKVAASELYAFSTETLEPVSGTTEGGVLAGVKVLKPLSNKLGEALLEPQGITVDPATHEIIIVAGEETVEGEPVTSLQRVSDTGVLGARWVDDTDYFEDEASSPVVDDGKVLVDFFDELDEVPYNFNEATPPTPLAGTVFEPLDELLTVFPGEPPTESGGSLTVGPEGTIYTRASITEQLNGKKTGYNYPGVLEFTSAGTEIGWTGGQSAATGNGLCTFGVSPAIQLAAGSGNTVFAYFGELNDPKVVEFGPGGGGCPQGTATAPTASVNGVPVEPGQPVPKAESVTLSSNLTEANALSVEWNFGDGTKQTVSTDEYQTTSITHKFAKSGELTVTEVIHTDNLETPVIEEPPIKIDIQPPAPTATTGEATSVGDETATVKGAVNPNDETVTECEFQYGTTTSYGKTAPCVPSASSLGTGTSPVPVTAALKGLAEHTTYYFRLVAKSAGGPSEGAKATFVTGPLPVAVTGTATDVSQASAVLNATVNPEGAELRSCEFDYGTSTNYNFHVSCTPDTGTGDSPIPVSASLSELSPETTYHFAVVAETVSGVSVGSDGSFTTQSPSNNGGGGGGGGGSTTTTSTTPTTGVLPNQETKPVPTVTIAGGSVSVSSAGAFSLKLTCASGVSACSGTVTLKTLKAVVASVAHSAKAKAAILTLASVSFSIPAGSSKTISLHLSSQGRALLAHAHVEAAKATVADHDPAGTAATSTATVSLRLKAAKKHG